MDVRIQSGRIYSQEEIREESKKIHLQLATKQTDIETQTDRHTDTNRQTHRHRQTYGH